jgi:hypothetical protein
MTDPKSDEGTIQALLERLDKFRLPRALAIKAKVDGGELLADSDIQFLKMVFADASAIEHIVVERHPEYQELVGKLINLYDEITKKALENETQSGGGAKR